MIEIPDRLLWKSVKLIKNYYKFKFWIRGHQKSVTGQFDRFTGRYYGTGTINGKSIDVKLMKKGSKLKFF
jgi:hypothetical protein